MFEYPCLHMTHVMIHMYPASKHKTVPSVEKYHRRRDGVDNQEWDQGIINGSSHMMAPPNERQSTATHSRECRMGTKKDDHDHSALHVWMLIIIMHYLLFMVSDLSMEQPVVHLEMKVVRRLWVQVLTWPQACLYRWRSPAKAYKEHAGLL